METPLSSDGIFWKKLVFIFVFFTFTPLALVASVISLISITGSERFYTDRDSISLTQSPQPGVQVYASLPSDFPSIETEIITADARPEIIREYLKSYNSPMEPYA